MKTDLIAPAAGLVGVVVGALIQGAGAWWKTHQALKIELGVVVSELLRLHQQATGLNRHIHRRAKQTAEENDADILGAHELRSAQNYLHQFEKLSATLERARKLVAGTAPVAALQLDGMSDALGQLQELEAEPLALTERSQTERLRRIAAVTWDIEDKSNALKPLILSLARRHGFATRRLVQLKLEREAAETARLDKA